MLNIEVDLNPTTDQLKKWITGIEQEVLNDLTGFWHKVAQPLVVEEIVRVFATEGYGTWPPLSPKYAISKARHYPGLKMLRRQNIYWRAATSKKSGNIFDVTPTEMIWGVDPTYFRNRFGFPYPLAHEYGSTKVPNRPPKRSVFELLEERPELGDRLVAGLQKYLQKQIQQETRKHFG